MTFLPKCLSKQHNIWKENTAWYTMQYTTDKRLKITNIQIHKYMKNLTTKWQNTKNNQNFLQFVFFGDRSCVHSTATVIVQFKHYYLEACDTYIL